MRALTGSALGIVAAILVACAQPRMTATPTTQPPPAVPAGGVATPQPTPVASATPLPAPTPTATVPPAEPAVDVDGPLAAGGRLLTGMVLVPGTQVRYGLLSPGVARSDDGGREWRGVANAAVPLPLVSSRDPSTLYAGHRPSCYKDGDDQSFWRSTDGGQSWVRLQAGEGIMPVATLPDTAGQPERLYGISCGGLNVSTDGGETWELTGRTMGWDITSILPILNGRVRFLAVLTSEGGSSHLAWFDADGRLEENLFTGFNFWALGHLARAGSRLYIANSTGVWRQDDAGGEWQRFRAGLEDVVLEVDPAEVGLSEEDARRGFGLLALAPDPANPQRLALGSVRGLYISLDGGEQWLPFETDELAGVRVDQLAWDLSAPGTLYVTTPGGVFVVRLPA